jgi:hypothetical protein
MVLYCLIRRQLEGKSPQFLMIRKQGHPTFPPTKFRPSEDLYSALVRPMEEDLGLPKGSYFPEEELPMIPNAGESPRYPGMAKTWHLYPVTISLTKEALGRLNEKVEAPSSRLEKSKADLMWWSLDEVFFQAEEPNVLTIANYLRDHRSELLTEAISGPSMDALASQWAASYEGGVRVVRGEDIRAILDAGPRAFNLRVADPYLPYQKQGLGFTWSFFTPKDKQDVHVHGLPAVEIYGILEGRLQLWHKPMNHRGVRTWQCQVLEAGDWAEVEPLHCHFACWLTPQGLGTVLKAAATGELAGVGKLGTSGKTVCRDCSAQKQCLIPPSMSELLKEYAKPYGERDYGRIATITEQPWG